ncbi:hypothetical protein [Rhizobium sp. SL42]|uniref:hypothetical protein n=1 Tax=Rhizobium sp. SL42 TaxID=2806346 RepID=UPI001F3607A1|nr:hypothetical protein [Rhizobium sp. SL42]UJW73544.1 hypothetical protein IM739_11540 [Rhizobium sp. SL42]
MGVQDFDAAFTFRGEDLYAAVARKFASDFKYFSKSLVFLESTDDDRYLLFADMSGVQLTAEDPAIHNWDEYRISPFEFQVPVFVLTRQEMEDGEDPSSGMRILFRLTSNGRSVDYGIGVFEDELGQLEITPDELENPGDTTPEEKEAQLQDAKSFFIGARRGTHSVDVVPETVAPEILDWITHSFPEYKAAIVGTVFSDVKIVGDARKGVVPNVQLIGEVRGVWEVSDAYLGSSVYVLIVGSEQARLLAPDCPLPYSSAYIPKGDLQALENSVQVVDGKVELDNIKVVGKNLLPTHFKPAAAKEYVQGNSPFFALWLSRPLLSKTFDYRIGKNLGAMLGVHYSDRAGPIKWYMSGAWILEGVSGSAGIDTTEASVNIRFEGRTKFDALAYIDIGCFSYKLGDMDAFHEDFDFTLTARVYVSPEGKLVFVGGLGDLSFGGWQCFIDTFIDRYISSWEGLVAEMVVKYIVGQMIKDIVEGEITKAMGVLSLDIFDFKRLPIVGNFLDATAATSPQMIAAQTLAYGDAGLEIAVGLNNW